MNKTGKMKSLILLIFFAMAGFLSYGQRMKLLYPHVTIRWF